MRMGQWEGQNTERKRNHIKRSFVLTQQTQKRKDTDTERGKIKKSGTRRRKAGYFCSQNPSTVSFLCLLRTPLSLTLPISNYSCFASHCRF